MGVSALVVHSKGKNHEGRVKAKLDTLPLILTKNNKQKKKAEEHAEKKGEKETQVPNEGNMGKISAAWTSADAALRAEILWVARRIMMGDSKRSISGVGDLFRKMFPDSEFARGFQMERDKGAMPPLDWDVLQKRGDEGFSPLSFDLNHVLIY